MLGCSLCTPMRQLPSTHPPTFKHGAHRVCPTEFKSTSIKCFPSFSLFQTKMNIFNTTTKTPLQREYFIKTTNHTNATKNWQPKQNRERIQSKTTERTKKYNELVLQTTFAFTSTIYLLCLFKKLINESWKRVFFNFILLWHDFRIQCWIINVLITHVTYVMENVASENV